MFTVMLKFSNVPERLVIPLPAITIFTDPSVNFALQFQPLSGEDVDYSEDDVEDDIEGDIEDDTPVKKGEVISLDQFRKGNTTKPPKAKPDNEDQPSDSDDDA